MVGYAGTRARPGGEHRRPAEPSPSLSVMVGRTDPYTYYKDRGLRMTPAGLARHRARRALRAQAARRSVPRIAWQVFGSARHVTGRDIDYVARRQRTCWSPPTSRSPCRWTATRWAITSRLEIELAREALWVVA